MRRAGKGSPCAEGVIPSRIISDDVTVCRDRPYEHTLAALGSREHWSDRLVTNVNTLSSTPGSLHLHRGEDTPWEVSHHHTPTRSPSVLLREEGVQVAKRLQNAKQCVGKPGSGALIQLGTRVPKPCPVLAHLGWGGGRRSIHQTHAHRRKRKHTTRKAARSSLKHTGTQ